IERGRKQVGIAELLRGGCRFADGSVGSVVATALAQVGEEALVDQEQRALPAAAGRREQPSLDDAAHYVDLGQLVHRAEEASREQRCLAGETRERRIAVRELGERLAVGAPGGIPEEGEVLEVSERLEGLDPLRCALGELDRAACEPIALLDRESAVRVGGSRQKVRAGTAPERVVAQEGKGRVVVMRQQLRQLARPLAARLLDPGGRLCMRAASLCA